MNFIGIIINKWWTLSGEETPIKQGSNKEENPEEISLAEKYNAYQEAIRAYQFQIGRYNTFMNYFSFFNGALLVAYCTLLTSTTNITITNNQEYSLTNTYFFLLCMISILGIVVSLFWKDSLAGNVAWIGSWMKIIEKYESQPVYSMVIHGDKNTPLTFKDGFYSTQKLAKLFIQAVIFAWCIALLFVITDHICISCGILGIIVFLTIYHFVKQLYKNWFYSDLSSKQQE